MNPSRPSPAGLIGVIGGMGPRATVDFLEKVIEETEAVDDEAHLPMLVSNNPRVPPRPAAILAGSESPLPALLRIRDRLLGAGATALVMPCNTAHHWYAQLAAGCATPFISIVEAGCNEVRRVAPRGAAVAVLSTRATQAARLFDAPLSRDGFAVVEPSEAEQDRWLQPAIAAVKAGQLAQAGEWLDAMLYALAERGVGHILLACTELPAALAATRSTRAALCIDTTRALARATVAHWRQHMATVPG